MDNGWQTDEHGQRFRRVGNAVEFEMMVHTNGIEVPQSELSEFHARQKVADEERRKKEMEAFKNKPPTRYCPFNTSMYNQCKREGCVMFLDGGCSIAILADAHGTDQPIVKGAKCPFSVYARCDGCAVNNGGCAVVRLAAATNNK